MPCEKKYDQWNVPSLETARKIKVAWATRFRRRAKKNFRYDASPASVIYNASQVEKGWKG